MSMLGVFLSHSPGELFETNFLLNPKSLIRPGEQARELQNFPNTKILDMD